MMSRKHESKKKKTVERDDLNRKRAGADDPMRARKLGGVLKASLGEGGGRNAPLSEEAHVFEKRSFRERIARRRKGGHILTESPKEKRLTKGSRGMDDRPKSVRKTPTEYVPVRGGAMGRD